MTLPPFDPSKAVSFDLAHGHVEVGDGPRRVLVPVEALAAVCRAAGDDATAALARALGEPIGRRVAAHLGDAAGAAIESVLEHLGGELAIVGLGSLGLERWGRALVLTIDHAPLGDAGDALTAGVLEAALSAATSRALRCVSLARSDGRSRFLATSAAGADKVRKWQREGAPWGEILVRLHGPNDGRGDA